MNRNRSGSLCLLLIFLVCKFSTALAWDPGSRDTCEVECLESVPALTQIAVPIKVYFDEPIDAIVVPLEFWDPSNTEIICDSVSFAGSVVLDSGFYEFASIDTVNYQVNLAAIDFSGSRPIVPGSHVLATLFFSTGPNWNPSVGVLINTYISEFWQLGFWPPLAASGISPLFIPGCLSRNRPPDFDIVAKPDTLLINVGDSASVRVNLTSMFGFSSVCSLAVGGLPVGVSSEFDSLAITPTSTTMLRIFTSDTISREQQSNLTVAATSGKLVHGSEISITLIIPGNEPPFPFALSYPANGATLGSPFTLGWQGNGDPDLFDTVVYTVYYSTDSNFSVYDSVTNISQNSSALKGLPELTQYYWRVKATDKFKAVTWSTETWKFITSSCWAGDVNRDGNINASDPIYLLNYLLKSGPAPICLWSADVDSIKGINIGDVNYLVTYIFLGGSPPYKGPFPDTIIPISTSDTILLKLDKSVCLGPNKYQFSIDLKNTDQCLAVSIPLTYGGISGASCDSISGLGWSLLHADTIDYDNRTILIGAVGRGTSLPPGTHSLANLFFTVPDTVGFYIDSIFIKSENSLLLCSGPQGRNLVKPQFERVDLSALSIKHPPSPFSLLIPTNGDSLLYFGSLHWTWQKAIDLDLCDTVKYTLFYSADSTFTTYDSIFIDSDTSVNDMWLNGLTDDTSFYWRVSAKDRFGENIFSDQTWIFRIPKIKAGDVFWTSSLDYWDVVYLLSYISDNFFLPFYPISGDVDSIPGINIGDVNHLGNYLFSGGPEPYRAPFPNRAVPVSVSDTVFVSYVRKPDPSRNDLYEFNIDLRNADSIHAFSIPLHFSAAQHVSGVYVTTDSTERLGQTHFLYDQKFDDTAQTLITNLWLTGDTIMSPLLPPGRGTILRLFLVIPNPEGFSIDTTMIKPDNHLLLCSGPGGRNLITPQFSLGRRLDFPEVTKVTPNNGVNTDTVFTEVEGFNFSPGLTIELSRAGQTSIVGESTTVTDMEHITSTFNLAGRAPGNWDIVVTNPDGKADTLVRGFLILEFGPEAVLRSVANTSALIEDLQAEMWVSSWLDTMTLYENAHLFYKAKAPDKTKVSIPESESLLNPIISIVTNGWKQFSINHYTHGVDELNLLEEGEITPGEFEILDLNYNTDRFLANHSISLSGSYMDNGEIVYVIEAVPTWSERLYSKLDLHVKYDHGIVNKLITYVADTIMVTTEVSKESLIDGRFWVATEFEDRVSVRDTLLRTKVVLDSIHINAGLPDNEFVVDSMSLGNALNVSGDTLSRNSAQQLPPLREIGGFFKGPPPAHWAEWQQNGVYKPDPVFLLHGFNDTPTKCWGEPKTLFENHFMYSSAGPDVYVRTPGFADPRGSLDGVGGWADEVSMWVNSALAEFSGYPRKVVLVGHSMGGLAAREYVVNGFPSHTYDPGAKAYEKVSKIVTIGTPNLGCGVAAYANDLEAGQNSSTPYIMPINSNASFVYYFKSQLGILGHLADWVATETGILDPLIGSQTAVDADFRSPFIERLNNGNQHHPDVKYYVVYGRIDPNQPWSIINHGDGFIELWSQVGIPGLPLDRKYEITAFHTSEPKVVAETGLLLKLLDDSKPNVEIVPIDLLRDCVSYGCSLKVRLSQEYLPATTELDIRIHKKPIWSPFGSSHTWFHPDLNWTPEGEGSSRRGVLDTLIQYPGPGSYGIEVSTKNAAGLVDADYTELSLGVDLAVWIWSQGRTRAGFEKTYTIACKNLGNVTANNVVVTFNNAFKSERWELSSLMPGESKNFSANMLIPGAPGVTELLSEATIFSIDEDVDPSNNTDKWMETIGRSIDPNDKEVHPVGFAANGFIPQDQTLRYTIFFENLPTATDSAIYITIKDTLDSDLDWRTLSFGPISHPEKCTSYVDLSTGVITWYFNEIMLPPDIVPPEGEGYVTFSIKPKHFFESGTQIKNRAAIQFDYNPWMYAPMDSSYTVNTVDVLSPNTFVRPLPDRQAADSFQVFWAGKDDTLGSGLKDWTIYVSVDGGAYAIWLAEATDTTAIFKGGFGHTYSFYCIGRDNVGNLEDPPLVPDALTMVGLRGDANGDAKLTVADAIYLINYLFKGGPLPIPGLWTGDVNCDGKVTVADVVYLINYLFKGGPSPCVGAQYSAALNKSTIQGYVKSSFIKFDEKGAGMVSLSSGTKVDVSGIQLELAYSPTDIDSIEVYPTERAKRMGLYYSAKDGKLTIGLVDIYGKNVVPSGEGPLLNLKVMPKTVKLDLSSLKIEKAILVDTLAKELEVTIINDLKMALIPKAFSLSQNYPNPFNPNTIIEYALPMNCNVKISIYNILGQRVRMLIDENQTAGYKKVVWDSKNDEGQDVASGIYFYKIKAGDFTQSKKMVMIK